MAETDWFYIDNGSRVGPVSQQQICELFSGGKLGLRTQVWCSQFSGWTEASTIRAFRDLARSVPPPPLPPPPFASVVAMPTDLPSTPPPLPPLGSDAVPFASPVAAAPPVFLPNSSEDATDVPAAIARVYPSAPPTAGPPLMTPHPHSPLADEPAEEVDTSVVVPWQRLISRAIKATRRALR